MKETRTGVARRVWRVVVGVLAATVAVVAIPARAMPEVAAAATIDQTYQLISAVNGRITLVLSEIDATQAAVDKIPQRVWTDFTISGTSYAQVIADTWRSSEAAKLGIGTARTELSAARTALAAEVNAVKGDVWTGTSIQKASGPISVLQAVANAETWATTGAASASSANTNAAAANSNAVAAKNAAVGAQGAVTSARTVIDATEEAVLAMKAAQATTHSALLAVKAMTERIEAQTAPGSGPAPAWSSSDVSAVKTSLQDLYAAQVAQAVPVHCAPDKQNLRSDWWTSLTTGIAPGPYDNCEGYESALKRAAEYAERQAKERALQRRFEELQDRVEDEQKRVAAEQERRQHDREQIDRLLGGIGELGEELGRQLEGLGEKVDGVKRAVEESDGGGSGPNPGTDVPGPGELPSDVPGLGQWNEVAVCVVPKVEGSLCSAPSIDIPGLPRWYPLGDCAHPPAWLPAWRGILAAFILIGAAMLCFKWLMGALGVPTPAQRG